MKINIKKTIFLNKNEALEVILHKNNSSYVLDNVAKYLDNGINVIILTNHDCFDCDFLDIAVKIRQLCSIYEALFIVSKRADIAKLAHADGILTDNSSIPKDKLIKILSDEILFSSKEFKENFDFYILNTKIEDKSKIIFSKTQEKDDFIFYKRQNYDYN